MLYDRNKDQPQQKTDEWYAYRSQFTKQSSGANLN